MLDILVTRLTMRSASRSLWWTVVSDDMSRPSRKMRTTKNRSFKLLLPLKRYLP